MKRCTGCKEEKNLDDFHRNKSRKDGRQDRCKVCVSEAGKLAYLDESYRAKKSQSRKDRQHARRKEVINFLGGECSCCHETEFLFLTIDHVNNDGAKHREELKIDGGGSEKIVNELLKTNFADAKRFQILCWNCNCGKQLNGGFVCPHWKKPPLPDAEVWFNWESDFRAPGF